MKLIRPSKTYTFNLDDYRVTIESLTKNTNVIFISIDFRLFDKRKNIEKISSIDCNSEFYSKVRYFGKSLIKKYNLLDVITIIDVPTKVSKTGGYAKIELTVHSGGDEFEFNKKKKNDFLIDVVEQIAIDLILLISKIILESDFLNKEIPHKSTSIIDCNEFKEEKGIYECLVD